MKIKVERDATKARWERMPSIQDQLDAIWELLPKAPGSMKAEGIRTAVINLKERFKPQEEK